MVRINPDGSITVGQLPKEEVKKEPEQNPAPKPKKAPPKKKAE